MKAIFFLVFIVCHNRDEEIKTLVSNREYDPEGFLCMSVCVYVCVRAWAICSQYTRRAFLMAVHSLTFGQTSCRNMSSSR